MNKKININPSSTKWLEKDDRVVADYFCDLGFRSLKQILDMRVFDLMNMQGLNAVRVEEVIICLYKWLNPNTAIDEAKSTKSVRWKCHVCGYEWKQQIKTRVNGGECPSCSNRCAITGYNDLASTEPELMKEWDYSKNKIDPTKILRTAYNCAWWKCEFGHSWNAPICDRTLGDCSCKECESEFIASLPQLLTMYYARENNLNVVLRTTDVIGLPVDAYIPYFNLVVDGFEHSRKIKAVKKSLCNQNGITYCEINSKDPFAMAAQIKAIFRKNHVYVTSENENDIRFCRNLFFSVKRKNARTS